MTKQKGFTLIEVIISVVILAIISTLTAANIQRSVKFKAKLDQDLSDYSAARDALSIISQDINEGFHWFDINQEIKKKMIQEAQAAGKPSPFPPTQNTTGTTVIPTEKLTAFVGEKDSLYLTTLSHQRIVANSPESDQAKVGYYLRDVKNLKDKKTSKGLIRRESTVLDDDVTKGGIETVLLENVKSLTFKYLGGDNKEWIETWNSISVGDDRMSNNFPNAVEINITTSRDGREVKLSTIAAVHAPNNDPFNLRQAAKNGGAGTPVGGLGGAASGGGGTHR